MHTTRTRADQRGFAIVSMLFVVSLLLILGTALTMTAIVNSQNTTSVDLRERTYDTAESGVADVVTALGNSTITSLSSAKWVNGNTFPQQADSNERYDYNVTFNTSLTTPIATVNPLASGSPVCGTWQSPGTGCVAIPPLGAFIAVRGHYGTRSMAVEAMAVENDLNLNGYTLITKGDAGTNGNGNVASDPCTAGCAAGAPTSHNALIMTDGNFNGGKGLIDGSVYSAGTATATIPSNCAPNPCVTVSGATPMPFPGSNNLVQKDNQWKSTAIAQGHYYGAYASVPASITVNPGDVWFINQNVDMNGVAITNNGGLIVITGAVTESGNQSAANYQLSAACNNSCTCHSQAQLVGLSTSGVAIHGQGTGSGHVISQGVIFSPSGPAINTGNGAMQAAVVAASAQIGGAGAMTADTCAAQAQFPLPGYNLMAFGED